MLEVDDLLLGGRVAWVIGQGKARLVLFSQHAAAELAAWPAIQGTAPGAGWAAGAVAPRRPPRLVRPPARPRARTAAPAHPARPGAAARPRPFPPQRPPGWARAPGGAHPGGLPTAAARLDGPRPSVLGLYPELQLGVQP